MTERIKRPTRAEADERIVREAGPWVRYAPDNRHPCIWATMFKGSQVRTEREAVAIAQAAARILNRIAKKRGGK